MGAVCTEDTQFKGEATVKLEVLSAKKKKKKKNNPGHNTIGKTISHFCIKAALARQSHV